MSANKKRYVDRQNQWLKRIAESMPSGLLVNHEGHPHIHENKDLLKLEKLGKIKRVRRSRWSVFGPHIRGTFIVTPNAQGKRAAESGSGLGAELERTKGEKP